MAVDRTLLNPAVLASWPTVSLAALSEEELPRFRRRKQAIELFGYGRSIAEIEDQTRVARSRLYRLIRRAMALHPDGRVFGFRGFLPYWGRPNSRVIARQIDFPSRESPRSTP